MRLFVSLCIPEEMKAAIWAFVSEGLAADRFASESVAANPTLPRGRFMDPASYHITLAFIGEVDESVVGAAALSVREAASFACESISNLHGSIPSFSDATVVAEGADRFASSASSEEGMLLLPEKLGYFGSPSNCILWLGMEQTPQLMGLAQRLMSELALRSVPFDSKPFVPHVTLARHADVTGILESAATRSAGEKPMSLNELPVLASDLNLPGLQLPGPTTAGEIALFESHLSSEGATYMKLFSCRLGAR